MWHFLCFMHPCFCLLTKVCKKIFVISLGNNYLNQNDGIHRFLIAISSAYHLTDENYLKCRWICKPCLLIVNILRVEINLNFQYTLVCWVYTKYVLLKHDKLTMLGWSWSIRYPRELKIYLNNGIIYKSPWTRCFIFDNEYMLVCPTLSALFTYMP